MNTSDALKNLTDKYDAVIAHQGEQLRQVRGAVLRSDSDYRKAKRRIARANKAFLASDQVEYLTEAIEHLLRSKYRTAKRTAKALGINTKGAK